MGRKISKPRARQLQRQEEQRRKRKGQGKLLRSRRTEKQHNRENKEQSWIKYLRERGGFKPKRAKRWGGICSWSDCPKWEDGECAYTERDSKGCYINYLSPNGRGLRGNSQRKS